MFTNSLPEPMTQERKQQIMFFAGVVILTLLMSTLAQASGTDTTFDKWVDTMTAWLEGSLGKGISIAFVLVGIIMGITRQSLMAFAIGVGAALGLNYAPTILDSMFTAII